MHRRSVFLLVSLILISTLPSLGFNLIELKSSDSRPVHNVNTGLNYSTIQDAIDADETAAGHTILVDAGTHYEHIIVSKSVVLVGKNETTTIIDGNRIEVVMKVTADNVYISGFTIRNGGCHYEGGCVYIENNRNVTVINNTIYTGDNCVCIKRSIRNTIANNTISNSGGGSYGVHLYEASENTISQNEILNSPYGIELESSDNNAIIDNEIKRVWWSARVETGISLQCSNNNTISDSKITGGVTGVTMSSSSNNVFIHNNVSGGWWCNVYLEHANNNLIADNMISNGASNMGIGGLGMVQAVNNIVSGNTLYNNDYSNVFIFDSCNNTIHNNMIRNSERGIEIESHEASSNNTIHSNLIEENTDGIALMFGRNENNSIYHNSFIHNENQVFMIRNATNFWDNGYPSGGNYWSDHNPPDQDKDKIGDIQYTIYENNTDAYPLIYPYEFYQLGYTPMRDLNRDGTVNIIDVAIGAKAFNCNPGDSRWNPIADMDMNETINIVDLARIASLPLTTLEATMRSQKVNLAEH